MANEPSILESLIQEASSPETDPERLQELTQLKYDRVLLGFLWKNPNLPEHAWRDTLLHGYPEPWANPMAPFYLLAWTPREKDWQSLEEAALVATEWLWVDPKRCSVEGKQLLAAKVMEWWATSESGLDMMDFLGKWASFRGIGSQEHRDVLQILVKCVKTMPNLKIKDRDLLKSIGQWSKGRELHPTEVVLQDYSDPVKGTYQFIKEPYIIRYAMTQLLEDVASEKAEDLTNQAHREAKKEHDRFLADLIRQEMPIPPTAE